MVRKGSRVGGKTESNKVRRKKSLTEKKKKCTPLAGERAFSHVVGGLTETWVLLLLAPSLYSPTLYVSICKLGVVSAPGTPRLL